MIDYLTGNVPGGFFLYILFVSIALIALLMISRDNDLFTRKIALRWFFGIWAITTLIYFFIWKSNPPETAFSRYSVQFVVDNPKNNWISTYFQHYVESAVAPSASATNQLFLQRWTKKTMQLDCSTAWSKDCERIAEEAPINQLILGRISGQANSVKLSLELLTFPNKSKKSIGEIQLDRNSIQAANSKLSEIVGNYFPLNTKQFYQTPSDSILMEMISAFWSENYQKVINTAEVNKSHPLSDTEIMRWKNYAKIRIADSLALKNPITNKYETKKTVWQKMLDEASNALVKIAKDQLAADIYDPMLSNMIAEAFIADKKYTDAEQFLKIAFSENPSHIETLENLRLLHPSRYSDLPFQSEQALMQRILNILPMNENILQTYIEQLLTNIQVNRQPKTEILDRVEKILRINPQSYTGHLLLGKYHLLQFSYEEALAAFEKAQRISPNLPEASYNIGVVHYQLKQIPSAKKAFEDAIEIDDFLDAHLYLGAIYQEAGEYEKALEYYRYRVTNKKGDDDYYAKQAMKGIRKCLEALGQLPEQQ